jgi:hypothetical protein
VRLRILEQLVERAVAVERFVEPRLAAPQRLLDHRTPDALFVAALGNQRLDRLDGELERLGPAIFVGDRCRRRRLGLRLGRADRFRRALLRRCLALRAHEIVVIDELVAVRDQQVGRRVLDADADNGFGIFSKLTHQR